MMIHRTLLAAVLAGAIATGLIGCGNSDSDKSAGGGSDGGSKAAGADREAVDFAMTQVPLHWAKSADGWATARNSGSSFAPIEFVRQIKEITALGATAQDLGESDKLNGFEWAGEVYFKKSPCREAGEIGYVLDGNADINVDRVKGRWSQWIDYKPESLRVQKVKGKWQVSSEDQWLLRGKIPTAADFAKAGVK